MESRTNRLANSLLGSGLRHGDRIAAWMTTSPEYVQLYFAAAKAGLVVTPINEMFKEAEASYQLENSRAAALFFSDRTAELAERLVAGRDLRLIASNGTQLVAGALGFDDLVAKGTDRAPAPPDEDDLFVIGYTSGTTGFPKGAMLTHRSVKNIARMNAISYRLPIFSICAYNLSMSFVATVNAFLMTHLHLGGTILFVNDHEADVVLDVVERYGATFTSVPSPLIAAYTEEFARRPHAWRSLHTLLHSASKATPELLRALAEVIGDRYLEGWGMTENSGGLATATTLLDATGKTEAHGDLYDSAGRAVADAAVEVVGPDGERLPHDGRSAGELLIRSAALMKGYWGNPEATAKAIRDGWYHSGDIGTIDPAGYIYIADRRDDLIVSGGMNVYPTEVERVVALCPGVAECAVVGSPHPKWGSTVVAFVVRTPGSNLTEKQVIDFCKKTMASYKKPTRVVFIDQLPRTVSQKVKRRQLREMLGN
jgi:acyl-CoA synthetase (AMP-forming)/AMP-acid ligase II